MGALCSRGKVNTCCKCLCFNGACCQSCLEKSHVLFVGPSGAGKSTIIQRHIVGEWVDVIPTVGFVWRKLGALPGSHRSWEVFDFGGTQQFRPLIRHMYHGGQTDAIVYVVSATPNLTPADAIELKAVCRTSALRQVPLLIVLNKCDLPGAIGAEEALRLMGVTMAELSASGRKVDFVTASAKTGVGLDRIMQWLASLE